MIFITWISLCGMEYNAYEKDFDRSFKTYNYFNGASEKGS